MGEISTQNLVLVALTLAISAAIPALFSKLPVPGVVFEIVIGAIIGPQVFIHDVKWR
jgi:Kef-type K+ transport system membrane component KefB